MALLSCGNMTNKSHPFISHPSPWSNIWKDDFDFGHWTIILYWEHKSDSVPEPPSPPSLDDVVMPEYGDPDVPMTDKPSDDPPGPPPGIMTTPKDDKPVPRERSRSRDRQPPKPTPPSSTNNNKPSTQALQKLIMMKMIWMMNHQTKDKRQTTNKQHQHHHHHSPLLLLLGLYFQ